jgi:hypothetical protein
VKHAAFVALAMTACTVPADAPRAAAQRVATADQLIGGPKAIGQIGDYLLENDQIRVIIANTGVGRIATPFGGSLIDADLRRPQGALSHGNDEMGELLPSFLLELMNPVSITIVNDGLDGNPAVIREDGTEGDLLQMVAILNNGLLYPPDLSYSEEFRLEPGKHYVEITTSIKNNTTAPHPLPFLNPPELKNLGLDIPDLDKIKLSVPLGHFVIFGGENQAWTPGVAGFNVRFAIEDTYPRAKGFPAFPGLVTEYLATRGKGVSYGLMVPSSTDNYPNAYQSLYAPDQEVTDHSMLLPYVYAAVTGCYTANPPPVIGPKSTYSFKTYFVVGHGDVASVVDVMQEVRGTVTGSFGGRVVDALTQAPVEHAAVVVQDARGRYVDEIDSNEAGLFRGNLPPGDYTYRVVTNIRPTTAAARVTINAGETTGVFVALPPPSHLALQVVDEVGRAVPCKVSLIGHSPPEQRGKDPRTFLYDLHLGETMRGTTFDPTRLEYIEKTWYLPNGLLSADVRPGTYDIAVSRGVEYDLHNEASVSFVAGAFVSRQVALTRALDTSGYVSADLHLHSVNSVDSDLTLEERITSIAGEGLDFAAATDHNFLTDYAPTIAKLGLQDWLTATIGLELTTSEMGHFNGYPLRIDPGNVRGADFVWDGQPPASLFKQLRDMGEDPARTIVEVNHPRDGVLGYFTQFNVNTESGETEVRSGLRAVFAPFKPEFAPSAFSYDFDTLEVVNGKRPDLTHVYRAPDPLPAGPLPTPTPAPGDIVRDADGKVAFPGQVEDWFTFLSRGLTYTALGNSDSHTGFGQEPGYPRNFVYVGDGKDVQGHFDRWDVVAGLRAHRVVVTNGPMIDFSIAGQPMGSTVTVTAGTVSIDLTVQSPNFAPVESVRIWSNGELARELSVPSSQAHRFHTTVDLPLSKDAWFVVEATGSANLFPVVPPQEFEPLNVDQVINALGAGLDLTGLSPTGALKPSRTSIIRPDAITNPIWVDHDGNHKFDPPLPPLNVKHGKPAPDANADVRRAFEELR